MALCPLCSQPSCSPPFCSQTQRIGRRKASVFFRSIALSKATVATQPIEGQKPGTSGLRKKVAVFTTEHYLENFVQATFNALKEAGQSPQVLVVGGDGRFGCKDAAQKIVAMAAANGVEHVIVGKDALLSTPAVSALVRTHAAGPQGAFILTASHNPGGPTGDFGVKYNCANGGPAPEKVTDLIFQQTTTLQSYETVPAFPGLTLGAEGTAAFTVDGKPFQATVVDSVAHHAAVLHGVFDFGAIKALLARPDFTMVYDGMHGVGGPYARAILVDELGAPEAALMNCTPSEDFGAGHCAAQS